MRVKSIVIMFYILLVNLLISGCETEQKSQRVFTPTPTFTLTPVPIKATFDDNLCNIKGSFLLNGELFFSSKLASVSQKEIEGFPSYAISLFGYSSDGNLHNLTVWIKHSSSPDLNEMETLPNNFTDNDIKIHTSEKSILHANSNPVQLKLHVIQTQVLEPSDDPLVYCDYVIEKIQLQ